ncbi:type I polyketide synthase [Pseudovibrio flavus]|uniref:type I polyketide synthase n=1 Tax=Pseudovibrio flavus TaxID=2529854 RepID=UPI00211D0C41|nr:type I polyketide synthase [Pseudovibrio flavus]
MAITATNVDIIGFSCRLPGASNSKQFWELLESGTCSVSSVGPDRFAKQRFFSPDKSAAGKTYTFAAGQIDDPWGFDPAFFGISPREAVQMDPQQRLLLQVVWEALEHAGTKPSSLAGTNTGVYVGASALDYHHRFLFDQAAADAQFMTGNTLSIVANRISYIYDLRGPSFTIDTACSSSFVALHEALTALESGQIDTAIVCGVNLLLSPFSFMGFSRASMLSPQGLCRAFDAKGDGYVRSEGAVAFILKRSDILDWRDQSFARLLGSGLNSDGRTVGMSLPSGSAQAELLKEVYGGLEIDPNQLAFIEAHGTGTRVGDPAEAHALGTVLGQNRTSALPIGSVKTNVGHLEPVSGLVGLLKATLALKENTLPRTLHFNEPNPDIDFEGLNLSVAARQLPLRESDSPRLVGVNSFGFGGTNTHVVISDPVVALPTVKAKGDTPLILSAKGNAALQDQVKNYLDYTSSMSAEEKQATANALAYRRDRLENRLVVSAANDEDQRKALETFLDGNADDRITLGSGAEFDSPVVFVFSGNGAQWAGMGIDAYQQDRSFRKALERVDKLFMGLSGWSLVTMLFSQDLETEIERTEIAQPLLFGIEVAIVQALKARGIKPAATLGHSVGEVAAAWAAGRLSLKDAVKIIYHRSSQQEITRHLGGMAALLLSEANATSAIAESGLSSLTIAAINSGRSVTISGRSESLDAFTQIARENRWALRKLPFAYPFHCDLVEPIKEPLLAALGDIKPKKGSIPFFSSVAPDNPDPKLDAAYWWQNVRQPVRFQDAVNYSHVKLPNAIYLEVGPNAVLGTYLRDIFKEREARVTTVASLKRPEKNQISCVNPLEKIAASLVAEGGAFDEPIFFGREYASAAGLPLYPWQNAEFIADRTDEAIELFHQDSWPLLGHRDRQSDCEWYNLLGIASHPYLKDHKVDGAYVFPGAGFIEMAARAVKEWTGQDCVDLRDFDILSPLVLDDGHETETITRISSDDRVVEISSRPRLKGADWSLHFRGHYQTATKSSLGHIAVDGAEEGHSIPGFQLYELTQKFGLSYAEHFSLIQNIEVTGTSSVSATLSHRVPTGSFSVSPFHLDAGFHALFALIEEDTLLPKDCGFVPVRFSRVQISKSNAVPTLVNVSIERVATRSLVADFVYMDEAGVPIASLQGVRFKAMPLAQSNQQDGIHYYTFAKRLSQSASHNDWLESSYFNIAAKMTFDRCKSDQAVEVDLYLEAFALTFIHDHFWKLSQEFNRLIKPLDLVERQRIHHSSLPYLERLLTFLEDSGLAVETEGAWEIDKPSDPQLFQNLARESISRFPMETPLISLLARVSKDLTSLLQDGLAKDAKSYFSDTLFMAAIETRSERLSGNTVLSDAFLEILTNKPKDTRVQVAVLGCNLVKHSSEFSKLLPLEAASIWVFDTDKSAIEREERNWQGPANWNFRYLDKASLEGIDSFDILISVDEISTIDRNLFSTLVNKLVGGGLLLASPLMPSVISDIINGVGVNWWEENSVPGFPSGRARSAEDWQRELGYTGFAKSSITSSPDGTVCLIAAQKGIRPRDSEAATQTSVSNSNIPTFLLIADPENGSNKVARAMQLALRDRGCDGVLAICSDKTEKVSDNEWLINLDRGCPKLAYLLDTCPAGIVHMAGAYSCSPLAQNDVEQRLFALTELLTSINNRKTSLAIFAPGGAQHHTGAASHNACQAAVWAFGRVALNEYPNIDIKMIDAHPTLEPGVVAVRLTEELLCTDQEREVVIDSAGRSGLRIAPWKEPSQERAVNSLALSLGDRTGIDALSWKASERVTPGSNQVEIEVIATGLNFRDVMWSLGLLPEEALENGFAGASLGMECTGRITRTGEGVSDFEVGQEVIAFAPACFSKYVTLHESYCVNKPDALNPIAATTIPVAFLTAYYALVELARLKSGESVLIHGGAGGVGLAAIQIARWRGARIYVSAGSPEKRAYLSTLGVDGVFDSRSLNFDEQLMAETNGQGVDLVLNSLFGEAMERSLNTLKPFGRFCELGKRDFFSNNRIGLRPFRQNLSYFGIDADQLLSLHHNKARLILSQLMELFTDGTLTPLPFRVFDGKDTQEAFRLMQRSGHIGKIVIKAPQLPEKSNSIPKLKFRRDGAYIVVGGTGGFGGQLAILLAKEGARNIYLLSRSGDTLETVHKTIKEFSSLGVKVTVMACDVSNKEKLSECLTCVRESGHDINGIFHCAMSLRDGLINNLSNEDFQLVLDAKIQGASHLDELTSLDPIDHFVLFSSATTIIGNPGQANYVAANGYLEALAASRRQRGLAGLAISWGAISDVGFLARDKEKSKLLARKLGTHSLTSKEALAALKRLMSLKASEMPLASVAIANVDWSEAAKDLRLLSLPYGEYLYISRSKDGLGGVGKSELRAFLRGKTLEEATVALKELLAKEIARILRITSDEIDPYKPLSAIGMDSLMALELRTSAESQLGIEIPLMSIASGTTLADFARKIAKRTKDENSEQSLTNLEAQALEGHHINGGIDLENEEISAVIDKIERSSRDIDTILER